MLIATRKTPTGNRCFIFFEENELGGYTITVPSLPGLVTEAKDMKQAKVVLEDAVMCYLEGLRKAKKEEVDRIKYERLKQQ